MKYGENLSIGRGCRFDLINPEKVTLFIGKNCEFGNYCHIVATSSVVIGNNLLCASKVFISDTSHGKYKGSHQDPPNIPPNDRKLVSASVTIGDNVWLGDNVVILGGSNIGNGCIIGANAIISKDIPPNSIVVGNNRIIKKWNDQNQEWKLCDENSR